jgi:DNA replication and repair protein RecF
MVIKSLELHNFRNYKDLAIEFSEGTNILFGGNAQGKTNILEAIFISSTTKSHKSSKDKDIINFFEEEAHIRTYIQKGEDTIKVDMHLRSAKAKGIAIDNQRIKKSADLMGKLNVVFFSPEDLAIIKSGPAERRRFADIGLCQLDAHYLYCLNNYNRVLNQRNKLLRDIAIKPDLTDTISVWNEQLVTYGGSIILRRRLFAEQLNKIIGKTHMKLSGDKEFLLVQYDADTEAEEYEEKLKNSLEADLKLKQTTVGPHRDDFSFFINNINVRKFGSQGQQRTVALSLKLSEIELIKMIANDTPVLLLDDVLSELDRNRQNYLLDNIGNVQTIVTCTGLEEFVNRRFQIDRVFFVMEGNVECIDEP